MRSAHLVAPELVGPRGVQMFHFGGPGTRFQREKGDFSISYQYYNEEPVMAIARRTDFHKRGVVVVALSAAWQYADSKSGEPTDHCMTVAAAGAGKLGLEFNQSSIFKLADIIVDGLPELLKMKPKPDSIRDDGNQLETVGEATFSIDGQKFDLGEIKG